MFDVRSYGYALASVVLALVVGWAGRITWQELRQLHRSFASVQADAFHLSEHIEASVRDLNETVLRFDLRRQTRRIGPRFRRRARSCSSGFARTKPPSPRRRKRELMGQIEAAFEVYLSRSHPVDGRASAGRERRLRPQPMLERVENQAAPILDLCEKLKAAERAAQTQFMKDSHRALGWLQQLLDRATGAAGRPGGNRGRGDLSRSDWPAARRVGRKPRPRRAAREAGLARHAGRRRGPRNPQSAHGHQRAPAQPEEEPGRELLGTGGRPGHRPRNPAPRTHRAGVFAVCPPRRTRSSSPSPPTACSPECNRCSARSWKRLPSG